MQYCIRREDTVKTRYIRLLLLAAGLLTGAAIWSQSSATTVDQLLERTEAPPGVVFEIVTGDSTALRWAIPQVRKYIQQLRARFPDLPVAVVTHGREQFALQTKKQGKERELHQATQALIKDDGVPLHVCGTHADWFGVAPEDFPDYVDVAPQAPTQIYLYQELGYELVEITYKP